MELRVHEIGINILKKDFGHELLDKKKIFSYPKVRYLS
jgi:hypothetical protein